MGFIITEEQVFELMRQMDDNFDGRISFAELKKHILKLGFPVDKALETRNEENESNSIQTFTWRDKALELIITAFQRKLKDDNGPKGNMSYEDYLKKFDTDHDKNLSPQEFRMAMVSLKEQQLTQAQIDRVMHILIEEKKRMPMISIERVGTFFRSYKAIDEEAAAQGTLLIDEDLFVYIVERYDGFSRLLDQFNAVEERSQYISRHTHEIGNRSMTLLSNQLNLDTIHRRAKAVNTLYESTLILLAGQANKIIRDEAQLCVLDPSYGINEIVGGAGHGQIGAVTVPTMENSTVDIDYNTVEYLPSGAQRLLGTLTKQRRKVEVLIYGKNDLIYVSADGSGFRRHLDFELRVHRSLMGVGYYDDDEAQKELVSEGQDGEIVPNIGKSETKMGLAASDTEIRVVNELIDADQWINLDDFVMQNGGILNVPLFYHTDAPLFIIRHWAKLILKIVQKVHDMSAVLRCL